jgi:aspartyl-tRNA(Asn)/glutamyl-tRNA(Gln) amidotransferase subunit C
VAGKRHQLDREQIGHLCDLARLTLSPEEEKALAPELSRLLDFVALIKTDTASSATDHGPAHAPSKALRDDRSARCSSHSEALANAPAVSQGHFSVPLVVDQHPDSRRKR